MKTYPDDTFITSYPKSGEYVGPFFHFKPQAGNDETDFVNLDRQVPDTYKVDGRALELIVSFAYHFFFFLRRRCGMGLIAGP